MPSIVSLSVPVAPRDQQRTSVPARHDEGYRTIESPESADEIARRLNTGGELVQLPITRDERTATVWLARRHVLSVRDEQAPPQR
ncbi:MAG TPA: hypothetical protein VN213_21420 [Solirubrobacteraceae bacterium]|nr:hypothetical protein [Solirubrobacteraceae bacterium]